MTNSVVVFAVRKGNPKNIQTWADLTKDGVDVITPNPFTSGGAKWNVMAAYGANSDVNKNKQAGEDYLRALFKNVSVQSKSAREALQTFVGGKGDVLIAYENEAITAQQKQQDIDYVIPDATILIQNPIAATTTASQAAKDFVDVHADGRGPEDLLREGLPPGEEGRAGGEDVPDPERALQHRRPRRLAVGEQGVLRPGHGPDGRDQQEPGTADREVSHVT